MAQLYKDGILLDMLSKSKTGDTLGGATADIHQIKADIYNYCARFDCVPVFTYRLMTEHKYGNGIEVRIDMPQQGIYCTGTGTHYRLAEMEAAIRFKQAAEAYQAQHGREPLIIQDSTSLTVSSSRKFFQFYNILHPSTQIISDFTPVTEMEGFRKERHQCRLVINGQLMSDVVEMNTKKAAEDLAYLTAAVALKVREPRIFFQFLKAWKAGHGDIRKPLSPIGMELDGDCVLHMRQTLAKARQVGLPDEPDEQVSDDEDLRTTKYARYPYLTPYQAKMRDLSMQKAFGAYLRDPKFDKLRRTRSELPVNQYSAKVLDLVKNSMYSIIVGATGSGKTTQVPQIILEHAISKGEGSACNIICTQPRRIAATSVARRVSEERGELLQETVGYQVRFLAKLPKARGSITFCTTGIVLKQLQFSPDVVMDDVSHLIIDEVHERDIQTDLLLVTLKKIMQQRASAGRSTPKVVLMSATINTQLFASYFSENTIEGIKSNCPTLEVPGRTFPVKEMYLPEIVQELKKAHPESSAFQVIREDEASAEYLQANDIFLREKSKITGLSAGDEVHTKASAIDWRQELRYSSEGNLVNISNEKDDALIPYGLVATTIAHIADQTESGAVLVFLPGLDEIVKIDELLREKRIFGINFNDESKFKLHMLHSSIPGVQTEVFNSVPVGCRKIILSTNIAETSITIPEVQYVVDTGKLKEKQYEQDRRLDQLKCTWISKSNCKQRAGRAGRVQDGHYYALFPRERFDSMRTIGVPELLRTDLQEVCLGIKAQAFQSSIRDLLASTLEPPSSRRVDLAIENLEALDAITPEEKITPLGRVLASLSINPSLGRMVLLGVIFRCLDPMVILSAAHSERDLFIRPMIAREQVHKTKLLFAQDTASDHIAVLNAVRGMRENGVGSLSRQINYAKKNFIHMNTYKTIEYTARRFETMLIGAGIIQQPPPTSTPSFEIGGVSLNQHSHKVPLIKALLLAGLHPNLAVCTGGRNHQTPGEQYAAPSSSSTNKVNSRDKGEYSRFGNLLVYSSMMRSGDDSSSLFLRETSQTTPLMAVLFGGSVSTDFHRKISMDNWLSFYVKSVDSQAVKTVLEFRKGLERLLLMTFRRLKKKQSSGNGESLYLADESVRDTFAQGLVDVLDNELRPRKW